MTLTEALNIAFTSEVTAGSYAPCTLKEAATQTYTGGPTCGQGAGTKPREADGLPL
jgi:hypothetical protein